MKTMSESSCSLFLCTRMFNSLHHSLFRTRCRSVSSKRYQKQRDLERAARHRERMAAIAAAPAPPPFDPPAPAQPDSVDPFFPSKSNEVFCTLPLTTPSEAGDNFEPNAADEVTSPWEEELEQLRATLERQTAELQRTDDYLAWIKAENRKLDKPRRAAIKELDKAKDSVLLVVNRGLKEGGNGSNQRAPHAAVHLAATEKVASARARAARAADLGHCLQHWPGPPAPSPAIFYNAIKLARGDAAPTQPQTHLYLMRNGRT